LLGPLLFLLFINDLPRASSLLSLLYADDTTFFAELENVDLLYDHVQKELCKAELWFNANRLALHPDKTRYILFSGKNIQSRTLKLTGTNIIRVGDNFDEKSFKLVGVHVDEGLTWKYHISKLKSKISCTSKR
jgi:hypothetical protein